MADRVAVFNDGKVQQVGTPEEIYKRPRNALRGRFRGLVERALNPDFVARRSWRAARWASLRPEAIHDRCGCGGASLPPCRGTIVSRSRTWGRCMRLLIDLNGTNTLTPIGALDAMPSPAEGEKVRRSASPRTRSTC